VSCFLISHKLALVNSLPFFVLFYCTCCKVFKIAFQVKFWDFNAMDASRRAFRTLQPFECHQIKSIQYSITGDAVLIAAGNAQVTIKIILYIIIVTILRLLYHWHRSTNTFRLGGGKVTFLSEKMYVMPECKGVEIVMQMQSNCMKNKNVHNFHETAI